MARKGWDLLSDTYRRRLLRAGITAQDYERGVSLARARGHGSEQRERFFRETSRFAEDFVKYVPDEKFANEYGLVTRDEVVRKIRDNVRAMGVTRGREYMRQARRASKLYESGDIEAGRSFWLQRPDNRPEYMYFYHGLFAY